MEETIKSWFQNLEETCNFINPKKFGKQYEASDIGFDKCK
jgi:hypothetical protein